MQSEVDGVYLMGYVNKLLLLSPFGHHLDFIDGLLVQYSCKSREGYNDLRTILTLELVFGVE